MSSGKVLVAGGQSGVGSFVYLATGQLFDPATSTWSSTASMSAGRSNYTLTRLNSGSVLAAGGYTTSGSALASAELYNPTTNVWTAAGSMSVTGVRREAVVLNTGNVLVTGGGGSLHAIATTDIYNSSAGTWSTGPSMITFRVRHNITLLADGRVLVNGGDDDNSFGVNILANAEIYDPASGAWTAAAFMSTARTGQTATLLPTTGKVLVVGGSNSSGYLSSAETYTP
jgi:hypothetical protein